ncbi:hypothetical protein DRN74_00145 [Candidatus Micrarchaeota archaeon]|nr:MAG: hypothetical protein DRN74_00145 [Candidatus Micrarchaeota archaeon]
MRKAQAFTVFKLLIASVFAVFLLLLVYFASQSPASPLSSAQILKELSEQSKKAPGLCFARDRVSFVKGEGFSFSSIGVDGVSVGQQFGSAFSCSSGLCEVDENIELPVSAKTSSGQTMLYIGSKNCQ